jgi:hypothetical protein
MPISIDVRVTPEAETSDVARDKVELMGVAVATEGNGDVLDQWRFPGVIDAPASIGDDWLLLGYDICDHYNTSALSNCAPLDRNIVPGFWRLAVNRHHLLDRAVDADAFRKSSDQLIPEHAPFVVVALFAGGPLPG